MIDQGIPDRLNGARDTNAEQRNLSRVCWMRKTTPAASKAGAVKVVAPAPKPW